MKLLMILAALLLSPLSQAETLYQQLGEKQGIAQIVEEMLFRVGGDERIVDHFEGVDIMRLHGLITDQVCDVVGGPCEYTGETMEASHQGLGITHADFNALVDHLIAAMEKYDVPVSSQNQLLAKLAAMYDEVVE